MVFVEVRIIDARVEADVLGTERRVAQKVLLLFSQNPSLLGFD